MAQPLRARPMLCTASLFRAVTISERAYIRVRRARPDQIDVGWGIAAIAHADVIAINCAPRQIDHVGSGLVVEHRPMPTSGLGEGKQELA